MTLVDGEFVSEKVCNRNGELIHETVKIRSLGRTLQGAVYLVACQFDYSDIHREVVLDPPTELEVQLGIQPRLSSSRDSIPTGVGAE